jgi:hypothetical protein
VTTPATRPRHAAGARVLLAAVAVAVVVLAGCGGDDEKREGPGLVAGGIDSRADVSIKVEGAEVTVEFGPRARKLAGRAKLVACASTREGGRLDTARADLNVDLSASRATAQLDRDISEGLTLCQVEAGPEEDLATVLFREP